MQSLPVRADLTAQAHNALRLAIISGELAPGTALAQEELAERLGVSRQPVSHALKLLKQEGLVVERGRKGQMVAPIDPERLLALYQVRGALDRLAAQLAAAVAPLPAEATEQLHELTERGSSAANDSNIAVMVESDVAFHRLLHQLSGNTEIATATTSLWPHIERAMRTVLEHHTVRAEIWREHRAIADAIIAGDAKKAGDLAARHAEAAGASTHQRLINLTATHTKLA